MKNELNKLNKVQKVVSLGYDIDDNEHFEAEIEGKKVQFFEEVDGCIHGKGKSKGLVDEYYNEVREALKNNR